MCHVSEETRRKYRKIRCDREKSEELEDTKKEIDRREQCTYLLHGAESFLRS
jgi:hypothetical protein